ncbi:MAG: NADPH-dependent FMN reductase [Micromonosporaceae bacterium]
MTRIAIITGTTRPGRRSEAIARWVHEQAGSRFDATFNVVDIANYDLPHLDEPTPPIFGEYAHPHTRAWSKEIAGYDGYVFVTPEYNHSTSGVLKNALDFLYAEWNNKSAGFVSYGVTGGVRAVEHLRTIVAELQMADVRAQVALSLAQDFTEAGLVAPAARHEQHLGAMLDQVVRWAAALRPLRVP